MIGILRGNWPLLLLCIGYFIPMLMAYFLERVVFPRMKSARVLAIICHTILCVGNLVVAFKIVWEVRGHTFLNIFVLAFAVMISMKLVSFAHVMGDLR